MYFTSRTQAGQLLAKELLPKYRYENCAVVALDDGGVMVGAQIARELHCVMMYLPSAAITLPRENEPLAGMTVSGSFTYNHQFTESEINEEASEYRGFIEQEKMAKKHEMNQLLGDGGVISVDLLKGQNVILVSDGLKDGFTLDMAREFLKPVTMEKIVVAVPLASVRAVDYMHVMADDLVCLSVVTEYMDTDHYYDQRDVPSHDIVMKTMNEIILNWR